MNSHTSWSCIFLVFKFSLSKLKCPLQRLISQFTLLLMLSGSPPLHPYLLLSTFSLLANVIGKNDLILLKKKKKVIQFIQASSFYCNPSLFFPEDQGLASAGSASHWSPDHGWGLSLHPACSHVKWGPFNPCPLPGCSVLRMGKHSGKFILCWKALQTSWVLLVKGDYLEPRTFERMWVFLSS